jgi:hypothetical protein
VIVMIIILVLCLIVGIAYSVFVYDRARSQFWDWCHSLVATLLSVMLALAAGFWVYDLQVQKADRQEKEDLTVLLRQELSYLRSHLAEAEQAEIIVGGSRKKVLITYVQPVVLEQAATSGLFDPVDSANMLKIAREIRLYNVEVEFLIAMLGGGGENQEIYKARIDFVASSIERARQAIISNIEVEAQRLQIDLLDE